MVVGYVDTRDERDRNRGCQDDRSGSRQDDRRDSRDYGQRSDGYRKREWRKTRDDSQDQRTPAEEIEEECRFLMFKGEDGKLHS